MKAKNQQQRDISYDINCTFADGTAAQIEMQGYAPDYDYGQQTELSERN